MLAFWGRAVDRLRWWLVALSLLPLTLWLGVPSGERLDESVVPPDMEAVRADTLEILPFGPMALNHDFTEMVRDDLRRAELVVLPLVLVFLVVVFGSVVAAALPLAVGLLGVAAGMAVTGILARVMPVSAYAANVVSMIGLGVAIDYSLFVVSRHREELVAHPPAQALARTLATAGRTVVFSGMTVGIGLLGMIL